MPDRVRFIAGARNTRFDGYIERLVAEEGYGKERAYVGVETAERAAQVRRALRQAGRHLGVSVKAFYVACDSGGCDSGGRDCAFHVRFSAYPPDDARRYMERKRRRS